MSPAKVHLITPYRAQVADQVTVSRAGDRTMAPGSRIESLSYFTAPCQYMRQYSILTYRIFSCCYCEVIVGLSSIKMFWVYMADYDS
jgi:hypothetical protein